MTPRATRGASMERVGPFDFWAAGTDGEVPERNRRWPRRSLLLFLLGMALVIVLVAVFLPHV